MSNRLRSRRSGRVARRLLLLVVVLAAGGVLPMLVTRAARPYMEAARIQRRNAKLSGLIAAEERRHQELRKAVARFGTADGMELEARRMGYLREGEMPLLIPR